MIRAEDVLKSLEGKTDAEKKEILAKEYNLDWADPVGPCKSWYARVFNYCNPNDLESEINFFLFLVNTFGYLWNICFNQESTIFLGCICPCGSKQTILYYSIELAD